MKYLPILLLPKWYFTVMKSRFKNMAGVECYTYIYLLAAADPLLYWEALKMHSKIKPLPEADD